MNENPFHSFMVADQVFLWHLPVAHDVNGSYQSILPSASAYPTKFSFTALYDNHNSAVPFK